MLPTYNTTIQELSLLQSTWSTQINPLIGSPLLNGLIIDSLALSSGSNVINHRLGRIPRGWLIIDSDASSTFYRSAPFTALTLTLTASATTTVSLYIF